MREDLATQFQLVLSSLSPVKQSCLQRQASVTREAPRLIATSLGLSSARRPDSH